MIDTEQRPEHGVFTDAAGNWYATCRCGWGNGPLAERVDAALALADHCDAGL